MGANISFVTEDDETAECIILSEPFSMSRNARNPGLVGSDQVRHQPDCAESDDEACIGHFGIRDIGLFLRDTGIFVLFILGYGIFRNFGIWDIGIYFGIRVYLILGYGIFWTVYFGIWDIAYTLNQASMINSIQINSGVKLNILHNNNIYIKHITLTI